MWIKLIKDQNMNKLDFRTIKHTLLYIYWKYWVFVFFFFASPVVVELLKI